MKHGFTAFKLNIRSICRWIIHLTTINWAGQPTKQTLFLCQEVERDAAICLPPQYVPQRRSTASKDNKEALDFSEIWRDHLSGSGTKSLTSRTWSCFLLYNRKQISGSFHLSSVQKNEVQVQKILI